MNAVPMTAWLLTLAIAVAGAGLITGAVKARSRIDVALVVLIAGSMLSLVWLPYLARCLAIAVLVGACAFIGQPFFTPWWGALTISFVVGVAAVFLLWLVEPLALLVCIVTGAFEPRGLRQRLRQLADAATCMRSGVTDRDLVVNGGAHALVPTKLPGSDDEVAFWLVEYLPNTPTSGMFEVRNDGGVARVDPAGATFDLTDLTHRRDVSTPEGVAKVVAALGLTLPTPPAFVELRWLPSGGEVTVLGRPEWEAAGGGLYRDASLRPSFKRGKRSLFISSRPKSGVIRLWHYEIWLFRVTGVLALALLVRWIVVLVRHWPF